MFCISGTGSWGRSCWVYQKLRASEKKSVSASEVKGSHNSQKGLKKAIRDAEAFHWRARLFSCIGLLCSEHQGMTDLKPVFFFGLFPVFCHCVLFLNKESYVRLQISNIWSKNLAALQLIQVVKKNLEHEKAMTCRRLEQVLYLHLEKPLRVIQGITLKWSLKQNNKTAGCSLCHRV